MLHATRLGGDPGHHPLQVGLLLGGAAAEQLGVGGHGGDGRAQLVGGVGHEPPQPGIGGQQALLGGDPGGKGLLDLGEHDVQGAGQPADLGGGVLPGHPLGQVACRDGLGGPLDVGERPQPQAHQPPPADQRGDDGAAGDDELDEAQAVEGGLDLVEGLPDGQVPAVRQRREPDPELRPALGGRGGLEDLGGLGAVRTSALCGVVRLASEAAGRNGRHVGPSVDRRCALERRHQHPGRRPHLDGLELEGVRRRAVGPQGVPVRARARRAQAVGAGGRAALLDARPGELALLGQLLVDPLDQEGLEGPVGDHVGQDQGDEGDGPDGQQETGAQRHGQSAAGSRRT